MRLNYKTVTAIAAATLLTGVPFARAQVATSLEQAELAGLSPDKRAEVEQRMKQPGQTVYEILQTILLNSIKVKYPGSHIMALDFNKGNAVVQTHDGRVRTIPFDTQTLTIKA